MKALRFLPLVLLGAALTVTGPVPLQVTDAEAKPTKKLQRQLKQAKRQLRSMKRTVRKVNRRINRVSRRIDQVPVGPWLPEMPVAEESPLAGTYPNLTLRPGSLGDFMFAPEAVNTDALAGFSVTGAKLGQIKTLEARKTANPGNVVFAELECEAGATAISWGYYWQAHDFQPGVMDGDPDLKMSGAKFAAGPGGNVDLVGFNGKSSGPAREIVATLNCLL